MPSVFPFFPLNPCCFKKSEERGFASAEALRQSSYGVPEGQPQCKSTPLRKEIQDVASKESRTVCVLERECQGERKDITHSTCLH